MPKAPEAKPRTLQRMQLEEFAETMADIAEKRQLSGEDLKWLANLGSEISLLAQRLAERKKPIALVPLDEKQAEGLLNLFDGLLLAIPGRMPVVEKLANHFADHLATLLRDRDG